MPGLLRGIARTAAVAGTATAVSNRVSRRQYDRWAQQDDQLAAEPPQSYAQGPPVTVSAGGADPRIAQLKELADLKAQGILNDEELAAEKARILGG